MRPAACSAFNQIEVPVGREGRETEDEVGVLFFGFIWAVVFVFEKINFSVKTYFLILTVMSNLSKSL